MGVGKTNNSFNEVHCYFIFSLQEKSVDKFPNTVLVGAHEKLRHRGQGL